MVVVVVKCAEGTDSRRSDCVVGTQATGTVDIDIGGPGVAGPRVRVEGTMPDDALPSSIIFSVTADEFLYGKGKGGGFR